jgi:DUF4097 and DUF4098 domain-containing protein YvlB
MRISRIIVAFAFLAAACSGDGGDNTMEFTDAPDRIVVDIASGNVSVAMSTAVDGVSVETTVDGDATPAIELAEGVLTISDDCSADCSIDYSILVAEDAALDVTTGDGNVTIGNTTGAVTVDAPAGGVTLASVVGELDVVVGVGDVLGTRLESGAATFQVTEGNIDITFDEVIASLVAATDKGDVTVQLPDGDYAFDANPAERTELRIDSTDGAANTVSLTTGDGDIVVYRR